MDAVRRPAEAYLLAALGHEPVLRACLYRYARNRADVDDLLQETYARLLVDGASRAPGDVRSIRAFALAVARNVALDWLRHQSIVSIHAVADLEAMEVLDEGQQVEEIVNTEQELARLAAAVAHLPPRARQVFTLRKVYGFSQQDIAARLGISEHTVEQHLQRAVRRCAQALFDLPAPERPTSFFARLRRRHVPQGRSD